MRAMTPPRRAPDPVQEVVENLNQHNKEEKLARARAKKQGKKPIVAESEGEEDEMSSDDEHADPKSKYDKRDSRTKPHHQHDQNQVLGGCLPEQADQKSLLRQP